MGAKPKTRPGVASLGYEDGPRAPLSCRRVPFAACSVQVVCLHYHGIRPAAAPVHTLTHPTQVRLLTESRIDAKTALALAPLSFPCHSSCLTALLSG